MSQMKKQVKVSVETHAKLVEVARGPGSMEDHVDAALRLYVSLPPNMRALLVSGLEHEVIGQILHLLIARRRDVAIGFEGDEPDPIAGVPLPPSRHAEPTPPASARPSR